MDLVVYYQQTFLKHSEKGECKSQKNRVVMRKNEVFGGQKVFLKKGLTKRIFCGIIFER